MDWLEMVLEWARAHDALLGWLFFVSLVLLLLTPPLVGWLVVRLPADYFAAERRQPLWAGQQPGVLRTAMLVAKNLAGLVLVSAGVVMLFVPGQGVLTMVVGLVLIDFPGKYRVERWLITRPAIARSVNWLRRRAGREPFALPC